MTSQYLTLSDIAGLFPSRNGRKVHVKTVRRWIVNGTRGVKLQAVRTGGCWFSTQAWLDQFVATCTQQSMGSLPPALAGRDIDHERSVEVLSARFGIHVKNKTSAVHDAAVSAPPDAARPMRPLLCRRTPKGNERRINLGDNGREGLLPEGLQRTSGRALHAGG